MSFETNFCEILKLASHPQELEMKIKQRSFSLQSQSSKVQNFWSTSGHPSQPIGSYVPFFCVKTFIFLLFDQISYFKALAFFISTWLSFLLERLDIGQKTNTVVCALHFFFCRSGKLGDWIAQLGTFEGCVTRWSKKSPRSLAAKVGV